MAKGLQYYKISGSSETVRFCEMFDRAFDCLHVRHLRNPKKDGRGYTSANDERLQVMLNSLFRGVCKKCIVLQWLIEAFLGYLREWDNWVDSQTGSSQSDKARLRLSQETISGWRMTGNDLCSILFKNISG